MVHVDRTKEDLVSCQRGSCFRFSGPKNLILGAFTFIRKINVDYIVFTLSFLFISRNRRWMPSMVDAVLLDVHWIICYNSTIVYKVLSRSFVRSPYVMFEIISFGGFQRHLTKHITEVKFLPLSILVHVCIARENSMSAGLHTFLPSKAILHSANSINLLAPELIFLNFSTPCI